MRFQPIDTPKTVIFLHVPKTAGTTLNQVMRRHYHPQQVYATGLISQEGVARFQQMSEAERAQYRLVKGHMTFGIHEYIPGPWAYFTFFRDPIERTISHFYYIRRSPEHPSYNFLQKEKIDLKQCLELGWPDPMLFNCHTRLFSGAWAEVPPGECTEEHLDIAKENLSQIKVVGLTEQFDVSLLLLGQAFGWNQLYYARQNVTARRPSQSSLSPETLAAVQAANRLDMELYEYAKALFEEQVSRQGPEFAQMVSRFQFHNRFVRPIIALYWEMRKISVRVFIRQQMARVHR